MKPLVTEYHTQSSRTLNMSEQKSEKALDSSAKLSERRAKLDQEMQQTIQSSSYKRTPSEPSSFMRQETV